MNFIDDFKEMKSDQNELIFDKVNTFLRNLNIGAVVSNKIIRIVVCMGATGPMSSFISRVKNIFN